MDIDKLSLEQIAGLVVIAVLPFVIMYYLIKGAVKNAILETKTMSPQELAKRTLSDRYSRGEIDLQQYNDEFAKI